VGMDTVTKPVDAKALAPIKVRLEGRDTAMRPEQCAKADESTRSKELGSEMVEMADEAMKAPTPIEVTEGGR